MRKLLLAAAALVVSVSAAVAEIPQLGSKLLFPQSELSGKGNTQTIEWTQNMQSRKEPNVQLTSLDGNMIFVQKDMIGKVSGNCTEGVCMLKVTKSYQYGQDSSGSKRFLVLHDTSRNPYQHRFMTNNTLNIFANGAQMAAGMAEGPALAAATAYGIPVALVGTDMRKKAIGSVSWGLKSVIGDSLRNF